MNNKSDDEIRDCPGAHLGFLKGRGGFLRLGHNFYFFQISSEKLRAHITSLGLKGSKSTVFSTAPPWLVPLGKF